MGALRSGEYDRGSRGVVRHRMEGSADLCPRPVGHKRATAADFCYGAEMSDDEPPRRRRSQDDEDDEPTRGRAKRRSRRDDEDEEWEEPRPRRRRRREPEYDPALKMVVPLNTSALAIIAGYLGLISVLCVPAPFALVLGILAMLHLKKHPKLDGKGRAIFAIVMGSIFSAVLVVASVAAALGK